MPAALRNGQVIANCPDCGAITTFESLRDGTPYASIPRDFGHFIGNQHYARRLYRLLRCAGCGRGGIVVTADNGQAQNGVLEDFYPFSIDFANLPAEVPPGISAEFREAERCAAFGARRAASALFRSTLEKTLIENGYGRGSLQARIDEAATDGVITEARKRRAHDDVRVLGNDVLHDEWRVVETAEVEAAHTYTQRILEDFYDDRATTLALLQQRGRLQAPPAANAPPAAQQP